MNKNIKIRAAILHQLEGSFSIEQMDILPPAEGEKQIEISAAGLNHRDLWIRQGRYPKIQLPLVLGSDGAGTLEGNRVLINPSLNWGTNEAYQAKDYRILGLPNRGTFASSINIPEDKIHLVPDHLNDEEAAALPLGGLTAYRALVTKCKPQKGEKVLISGIGGGVATMAFLFSRALGLETYVTSSSDQKIKKAIGLNAAGGVNYTTSDFDKQLMEITGGVDIVIDSAAGPGFSKLIKACNPGARVALYGGTQGSIDQLSPQTIFWKQISILGSTMGTDQEFIDMLDFVTKYKIRPLIDQIYPLEKINDAFTHMQQSNQFGKIILKVQP